MIYSFTDEFKNKYSGRMLITLRKMTARMVVKAGCLSAKGKKDRGDRRITPISL